MIKNKISKIDPLLFIATFFVLGLGLLTLFVSTYETGSGLSELARNQAVFALFGVAALLIFSNVNYRVFRSLSWVLYVVSILLLVLVLLMGKSIYGATAWLDIGFFQFQPSEIAKISLIVLLARYFSTRTGRVTFRDIMLSALLVVPYLALVLLQPDLGTALVMLAVWATMVLTARPKWQHVAALSGTALIAMPILWQLLHGYQKSRILVFVNGVLGRKLPDADNLGVAYNVLQSQIAVGAGQLFGRGIGNGTQGALNFLPLQSQHTDFIFAIFTEQLGFVGGALLIALFVLLVFRLARIAAMAKDGFGMYVAMGIFGMIVFHIVVNIGMNMGIMPVTGIPLPLFSYGGTALITTCLALGIVQSVYRYRKGLEFEK